MSAARWWIAAQGRTWGPYPGERLPAFREEGRLGPETRVAREADGPFARAGDTPELAALFAEAAVGAGPARGEGAPAAARSAADDDAPARRPLLVVCDAPEAALPALEAALGDCGEVVRIRPGLWLVRAGEAAAPVRNALSRRLRGGAMLLVVEAPLSAAAWFALEGDTDRALRRLWAG